MVIKGTTSRYVYTKYLQIKVTNYVLLYLYIELTITVPFITTDRDDTRISPRLARASLDEHIEFVCTGDDVIFFHNKAGLPSGTTFIPQTSTLILESVTTDMSGDYSCYNSDDPNNPLVSSAIFIVYGKSLKCAI